MAWSNARVGSKACFVQWAGKHTQIFEGVIISEDQGFVVLRVGDFDYQLRSNKVHTDIESVKHSVAEFLSPKKITIIGSTGLLSKMKRHRELLRADGHTVFIPAFDDHENFNELELCEFNRQLIELSDEVHIIWDGRSIGTIFDFGVAFGMRKPVKIIFIEPKSIVGLMKLYEQSMEIPKIKERDVL